MKLPETQNANHQFAFKKGYRLAEEGKSLSAMPSTIRHDAQMREYFQLGWTQFQEDFADAKDSVISPWRRRAAWFVMVLLAGVGTASLMISQIQQSQLEKEAGLTQHAAQASNFEQLPDNKPNLAQASPTKDSAAQQPAASLPASTQTTQAAKSTYDSEPLSLLNNAAREDLRLNKAEQKAVLTQAAQSPKTSSQAVPLPTAVIDSPIKIIVAQLTRGITNRQAINNFNDKVVPKNIRKLYYFTLVEGAAGTTIYHRWIHNNQTMSTIALPIKTNSYRTWSNKELSSAWQGEWTLEVLDANKTPIHRQTFRYVK